MSKWLNETVSEIHSYFDNWDTSSCINIPFLKTDRYSDCITYNRKLFDSLNNRGGGDSRFFIYFLQKHGRTQGTKHEAISTHSTILALELKESRSKQDDLSWKTFLDNFRYGKEFKQHLKTGHSELYSSLNLVLVGERNESGIYNTRYATIKSRIDSELGKIGVTDDMKANKPRLNIPEIMDYVLQAGNIKDWTGFKFKRIEGGSRALATNSNTFQIFGFDQPLADKLVLTLNSVFTSEILTEIKTYQEIRDDLKTKRKLFEAQLDELLRGIDSSTKRFKGVCDQCVEIQGGANSEKLRKQLSDLI